MTFYNSTPEVLMTLILILDSDVEDIFKYILNGFFLFFQAKLTCPCCNTRKKDAILTKCFHVFCFECLKTRYDTRQRKCPKCNATFGNNDFHRIYL